MRYINFLMTVLGYLTFIIILPAILQVHFRNFLFKVWKSRGTLGKLKLKDILNYLKWRKNG